MISGRLCRPTGNALHHISLPSEFEFSALAYPKGVSSLTSLHYLWRSLQAKVDNQVTALNDALHTAANKAGCVPNHHYKLKTYRCPEFRRLRHRKRFWWSLWNQSCRPRKDIVYECFKDIKKASRRLARHRVNEWEQCRAEKLVDMFRKHQICSFWNGLKKPKTRVSHSTISPNDFRAYYNDVINGNELLNSDQLSVSLIHSTEAISTKSSNSDKPTNDTQEAKILEQQQRLWM